MCVLILTRKYMSAGVLYVKNILREPHLVKYGEAMDYYSAKTKSSAILPSTKSNMKEIFLGSMAEEQICRMENVWELIGQDRRRLSFVTYM